MGNVTILWDIENVTPAPNTLFVDGLQDFAESYGRVVSARAYCDWSSRTYSKLGPVLARHHFYLVHVPSERKKKNSSDIQLVSDTLELLNMYGHIETFLLVTGDSDFRPLLVALRRSGKRVHVVCDLKTASQDLLALADSFVDYRELIPGGEDTPEDVPEAPPLQGVAVESKSSHRDYWFACLAEAVSVMMDKNKNPNLGSAKITMKMLNPRFNEKSMGYTRWSDFVSEASKRGFVRVEEDPTQTRIIPGPMYRQGKGPLQNALDVLVKVLASLDNGSKAEYHEYGLVGTKLLENKVNIKTLDFARLKDFIQAAEVRDLVESKTEGLQHYVRRVIPARTSRKR
jgi:uncharacterized LabA/DUF88 family protein